MQMARITLTLMDRDMEVVLSRMGCESTVWMMPVGEVTTRQWAPARLAEDYTLAAIEADRRTPRYADIQVDVLMENSNVPVESTTHSFEVKPGAYRNTCYAVRV